ncbi:uncharacterized protein LOC134273336 [Saccostrea cucullata]|uniref:uncharacterized protein LOC134273336 n=1 Tax=Saccostrea cuccullata TaxID=36930 RepID=UPI002ED55FA4
MSIWDVETGGQTKSLWASPSPTLSLSQIDCAIQFLLGVMQDKQKKYNKHADQFQQISETLSILNRVKGQHAEPGPQDGALEPDVATGGPSGTAESEEPVVRTRCYHRRTDWNR